MAGLLAVLSGFAERSRNRQSPARTDSQLAASRVAGAFRGDVKRRAAGASLAQRPRSRASRFRAREISDGSVLFSSAPIRPPSRMDSRWTASCSPSRSASSWSTRSSGLQCAAHPPQQAPDGPVRGLACRDPTGRHARGSPRDAPGPRLDCRYSPWSKLPAASFSEAARGRRSKTQRAVQAAPASSPRLLVNPRARSI